MKTTTFPFEKNQPVYQISDCTQTELDEKIQIFFASQGYKPFSSNGKTTTYTKGNKTMRILLGAVVEYYKQDVDITQQGKTFAVTLPKSPAGISGGLIGKRQAEKEYIRLNEAFKIYLGQ